MKYILGFPEKRINPDKFQSEPSRKGEEKRWSQHQNARLCQWLTVKTSESLILINNAGWRRGWRADGLGSQEDIHVILSQTLGLA